MARGALVRLQDRDGSRTADNEPSLACRASADIAGCVRKSLLRLRPSAYLTRDHRLGFAITLRHKVYAAETASPALQIYRHFFCAAGSHLPKFLIPNCADWAVCGIILAFRWGQPRFGAIGFPRGGRGVSPRRPPTIADMGRVNA